MPPDKVRFVTVVGNIDMDLTETFDMQQQMTSIRGAGYLMNETVYVPITSILAVFLYDSKIAQEAANTFNLGSDKGKLN